MASQIFLNTLVAGCTGLLGWLFVEQNRDGHPTTFGAASGVVAGLVAITPSCGTVNMFGALVIGLIAGIVCSYAVGWKHKLGYDDSLDVVGVHLVGGIVGSLLIGLLATAVMTGGPEGLFFGGGFAQLGKQFVGVVVVALYAFGVTYGLGKLIDKTSASAFRVKTRPAESTLPCTRSRPTSTESSATVRSADRTRARSSSVSGRNGRTASGTDRPHRFAISSIRIGTPTLQE